MTKTIYRYEVPVDGEWHNFKLTGHILHVGCRTRNVVEFWAHHIEGNEPEDVSLQAFGTGQPIPLACVYRGTAVTPEGDLVWHLSQAVDERLYLESTAVAQASPSEEEK